MLSAVTILTFLIIFEQRAPHFHFALGAHTYYVAGPAVMEGPKTVSYEK